MSELAKKCSHMRAEMCEAERWNKQQKDREHGFEKKLEESDLMYKQKLASQKYQHENELDEQKEILAEYLSMNVDKKEVFDLRKKCSDARICILDLSNKSDDALKYKKYWEEGINRKKELEQALAEKDAKIEQQLNEYEKKLREMRNEEDRRLKEGDQKDGEIECLRKVLTALEKQSKIQEKQSKIQEKQSKIQEKLLNAYEGKSSAQEGILETYKEKSRYQEERLTTFAAIDSLISKKKAHEAKIAALKAEELVVNKKIREEILSISEELGMALNKQEEEPISATSGGAAGSSTDPACPSSILTEGEFNLGVDQDTSTDAHVSEQKPDQEGSENGGAADLAAKQSDKAAKDLEANKPTEHADTLPKRKEDEAESSDALSKKKEEEVQSSDVLPKAKEIPEAPKLTEMEIQRAKDDFRKYMKQRHKFLEERSDFLKEKWPKLLEKKGKLAEKSEEEKGGFLIERRKLLDQYSEIRKEEDVAREEGNKLYAKFEKEWRKGGFYELRQWNELEEKWGELEKQEDAAKKEWVGG